MEDPIEASCQKCGFSFPLGDPWRVAVFEWMSMVFSSALLILIDHQATAKHCSSFLCSESQWFSLRSFATIATSVGIHSEVRHYVQDPRRHPNAPLPFWPKQKLMIANVRGLDTLDPTALIGLFLNAAALLRKTEVSFQDAIKRSAALAGSASEMLHPQTRR